MKKVIVLLLMVAFANLSSFSQNSQNMMMKVSIKNGTCFEYPVETVDSITFYTSQAPDSPNTDSELPKGYVRLKYVQSTATQYVNTGIYPTQDTNIETKICVDRARWWGGFVCAEDKKHNTGLSEVETTSQFYFQRSYSNTNQFLVCPFDMGVDYVLGLFNNACYVNGEPVGLIDGEYKEYKCANPLYLCRNNSPHFTGYSTIKMYYTKIYDKDVLVRYYIPCKNKSGVVGFYEKVEGKFKPSETTYQFVAGPEY